MELWLLRHGQTDWNLAGRWQGQSLDAPGLNETGRTQALAARDLLQGVHFAAIYSSDLLRARQTAALVADPLGPAVRLEPRLREMNLGKWEGLLISEIEAEHPQELLERARDPFLARAPGGESLADVARRVVAVMDEIAARHRKQAVLIVAHGIALAVSICYTKEIPLDMAYDHIPENAKPYHVEWKFEKSPVLNTLPME